MNNAMHIQRHKKTGQMTRIVLLISFIILLGRLIYTIPGAIEHHQQKNAPTPAITAPVTTP
ncbi:YfgG family protein [Erwiniaceae bacterium BAC15a-03b]|uniref:YfgG family protein n=1 Tax=Winslowiella arboricola TaxID=2978220 RepID=A0A9J6PNQ4_9GAMM|nr:YfgG family protein [Winslowiella arboricola]MCU5774001.1 YfgG family protein [Winslowiella arboricola]MCU5777272.1 YfgG family protein [Winslowiella arboricola]